MPTEDQVILVGFGWLLGVITSCLGWLLKFVIGKIRKDAVREDRVDRHERELGTHKCDLDSLKEKVTRLEAGTGRAKTLEDGHGSTLLPTSKSQTKSKTAHHTSAQRGK